MLYKEQFNFEDLQGESRAIDYASPPRFYRPRFFIEIPFKVVVTDFLMPGLEENFMETTNRMLRSLLPERINTFNNIFSNALRSSDLDSRLSIFPFLFMHFVSSVSVRRGRNMIGSATIVLQFSKKQQLFFEGFSMIFNQIFSPLLPLRIYMEGRFINQMICVFTGFITNVNYSDSGGFLSITITANDSLKLLTLNPININPGVADRRKFNAYVFSKETEDAPNLNVNVLSHIFTMKRLPDLLKFLVEGGETLAGFRLNGIFNFTMQKIDTTDYIPSETEKKTTKKNLSRGISIDFFPAKQLDPRLIVVDYDFVPYQYLDIQTPETFNSQMISRMDLIREVTGRVFYDFIATPTGDFLATPYRFHEGYLFFDFLSGKERNQRMFKWKENLAAPEEWAKSYVFLDDDVINFSFTFDDSNYITALDILGEFPFKENTSSNPIIGQLMMGTWEDINLIKKLGLRYRRFTEPLINNMQILLPELVGAIKETVDIGVREKKSPEEIKAEINNKIMENLNGMTIQQSSSFILDLIARERAFLENGAQYTGTATMILRPELDVGKPCYVPDRNELFLIESISHTINLGSDAVTSVEMAYGHRARPKMSFSFYDYLLSVHSWDIIKSMGLDGFFKELEKQKKAETKATG